MSRQDHCAICAFVDRDQSGQLYCRANPPSVQVIPVPVPEGVQMRTIAVFPPVQPQQWCGQWKPALMIASRLS